MTIETGRDNLRFVFKTKMYVDNAVGHHFFWVNIKLKIRDGPVSEGVPIGFTERRVLQSSGWFFLLVCPKND